LRSARGTLPVSGQQVTRASYSDEGDFKLLVAVCVLNCLW
jgi:hypothetical protein